MKVDILAIGVHPDDIELSCSGTLFRHLSLGYKVAICDMTKGELGSRGSAELRLQEADAARRIFGIDHRENLGLADGFFIKDRSSLLKMVEVIRAYRPGIVLANAERDRHPDHGKAADFVREACFLSGLIKIETERDGNMQEAWRPKAVYHYIQDYYEHPDIVVDISPFMEKKVEAIMAFKSQFYNPDSDEPETPISSMAFLEFLKGRAQQLGRIIGAEYGEGYTINRSIGTTDLLSVL